MDLTIHRDGVVCKESNNAPLLPWSRVVSNNLQTVRGRLLVNTSRRVSGRRGIPSSVPLPKRIADFQRAPRAPKRVVHHLTYPKRSFLWPMVDRKAAKVPPAFENRASRWSRDTAASSQLKTANPRNSAETAEVYCQHCAFAIVGAHGLYRMDWNRILSVGLDPRLILF